MNKIERAMIFAIKAHKGQKRRYTGEPYVFHPFEVASMLKQHTQDENMIAAAILHDTVEDCDVSFDEIADEFGLAVFSYVRGLTDISKPSDGNRAKRKRIDREYLSGQSIEVKVIKLFDLISNSRSIKKYDPKFWEVYKEEKRLILDDMKGEVKPSLIQLARSYIDVV